MRALEARGLVVREHAATDGRAVELVPTPLAEEDLRVLRAFWAATLREAPDDVRAAVAGIAPDVRALTDALRHAE